MLNAIKRYTHWVHTQWPAGTVEKLPLSNPDGSTNVPGVYIVGDLTGIPLLKFSLDTGARAVQTIAEDLASSKAATPEGGVDVAIIGAGVAGMAAAMAAQKAGLSFVVLEATQSFSTIVNFPKQKPIYTYPTDMTPAGELQVESGIREGLIDELCQQVSAAGIETRVGRAVQIKRKAGVLEVEVSDQDPVRASRVIVAIGRSGNYRKLSVPGEELDKVTNRLHDPKDYGNKRVLVVGGGDSALETAIAISEAGGEVTLSYRKKELARAKPENTARVHEFAQTGGLTLHLGSRVLAIESQTVRLQTSEGEIALNNDNVFTMIGREPPLDFFRRSGIAISGEWQPKTWATFVAFMLFCVFVYLWKGGFPLNRWFSDNGWFPFNVPDALASFAASSRDPGTFLGTLTVSLSEPGFYYTLAYTTCVVAFGFARIKRRNTPYVTLQTSALMAIQALPLFLLPYILLPYVGHNGLFDHGLGKTFADAFFPEAGYGHGREYWRAFGFILAWPLFIWNFFTEQPLWGWLVVGFVQTFVIIPLLVWRYGKGAYCGWVCSCGALAETLGDTHRHKMPHGPLWNRLNMVGQVALALALLLMALRTITWIAPDSALGQPLKQLYYGFLSGWGVVSYYFLVDTLLAGIVGVGFYFWFSGRVWCRFACPLAALMHIYARFSRFRIIPEKKKCISCNVCTSVCHQGIDVMSFANKGKPMEDPECVRCSACVQSCPTGVLQFGQVNAKGDVIGYDRLVASAVRASES